MKKVLILSDTHGYMDDRILNYAAQVDEVWHAGDVGDESVINQLEQVAHVRGVFGNIDGQQIRSRFPEINVFEVGVCKIFISHIIGRPNSYVARMQTIIREVRPQIVICGHSHILLVQRVKQESHLHINPGACGKHGFHKTRTMISLEINAGKPQNLAVIELGPRAEKI
jgi:putative phosphoesterase